MRENPKLAEVCELNPECIPDRKECLSLGLMKGRMIGVDGSLIKSNTSAHKNKGTEEYTDKYAGLYVRGNYLKGAGHLAYKLADNEFCKEKGIGAYIQAIDFGNKELIHVDYDDYHLAYSHNKFVGKNKVEQIMNLNIKDKLGSRPILIYNPVTGIP